MAEAVKLADEFPVLLRYFRQTNFISPPAAVQPQAGTKLGGEILRKTFLEQRLCYHSVDIKPADRLRCSRPCFRQPSRFVNINLSIIRRFNNADVKSPPSEVEHKSVMLPGIGDERVSVSMSVVLKNCKGFWQELDTLIVKSLAQQDYLQVSSIIL